MVVCGPIMRVARQNPGAGDAGKTMNRAGAGMLLAVLLACAGPVRAHHSSSMFDLTMPTWVRGTVVRYQPINPHVLITLEDKRAELGVRVWTVEGPALARLERMHLAADVLKAGDVIEVCGFPFRAEILAQRASAPPGGAALPSLHGHVLVMSDGRMRAWGPYGKLENCIRPDDHPEAWAAFLDTDPMAREYWCRSPSAAKAPSRVSLEFIDSISRRMARPCG
jgi:hypothetical protein